MKKNLLMLFVLLVLGAFAYYLVTNDKKEKIRTNEDYDLSYRDFAVEDISEVNKIVVVNRTKGVFVFKKNKNIWYVNDTFIANQSLVKNMLSVIKNVKIDYVPTEAAEKNIMRNMLLDGIKVEVYDKSNKPLKEYYVGGSPQNSIGTYFVMDGYSKPLVMTIPGFKGNLRVRFSYSLNNWRDRTVLRENIDEIKRIKAKYFIDKKSSFELVKNGNEFEILPAFEDQKKINKPLDQKFAKAYLVGFKEKVAEGIIEDKSLIEDVVAQKIIASFDIERLNGTRKSLKIFLAPDFDQETFPDNEGIYKYFNNKVHRYFALNEKGDLFQIQYLVFKDIIIPYNIFFKK